MRLKDERAAAGGERDAIGVGVGPGSGGRAPDADVVGGGQPLAAVIPRSEKVVVATKVVLVPGKTLSDVLVNEVRTFLASKWPTPQSHLFHHVGQSM